MNYLDDYLIHASLPESIDKQNVREIAEVVDKSLYQYNSIIPRVLIYPVIDTLPSELVDTLAVQLHCDFYDYTLSLEKRREIVKQSIAWHRIKGTRGAVEQAVRAVFGDIKIEEWYEYGGRPYTFRITVEGEGAFDENHGIDLLMKVIEATKNTRSWLEGKDGEGDSGITIHYEVSLSDEDAIRYGFAYVVDGMASIGIASPSDAVLRYLVEAFTGSSGRRTVGTGPSELTARLAQLLASANIRAGTGSIPYNPEDIPEWIRRITLPTRISEKLGFGYGLAGRRNVLLARPESAFVTPAPIILSGLAGLRQYGLAPPEEAFANVLLGNILARTGQGLAGADPDDIAALIPDIYENAKITAFYGSGSFAKGKRLLSLALPEETEILWRAATAQGNTGGVTVGADPEDLPDIIKELSKSILTPFFGSVIDSRGSYRISVAMPEETRLTTSIGIKVTGAGTHMVPPALPLPFDLHLVLADINARAGRLSIGADMSDMPDGQGDILQDAVITPYPAHAFDLKGVNRIGISQRIEDAIASLSVGFLNGESGLREIGIDPDDIPHDQKDILEDVLITPYMTVKAVKNGVTTIHGTRPEDSGIPLRTGMAGAGGGRKTIGVNPDDLPDYDKDFLKSSTVAPVYGANIVPAGKKRISPALPLDGGQTIFTGIATGEGGTSRISTELPEASRCDVLIRHADGYTGRGEIYPSRADMEKYLDGILDPARVSYNLSFAYVGKGQRRISADKPEDAECRIFVGGTQAITGHITIGADRDDLPPKKRIGAHVGIMQAGLSTVG